ncbi:MAG: hypothetical protein M0R17_07580 [Candidatus Omnitrophica bacterium]|jgi:hypothetical protein|nr:hypothetical protein [Candidatus Omnitrophota bacterium]
MTDKKLIIAVDFDGVLCENKFPKIGKQNTYHICLMNILIDLKQNGHKLILWTNRGDNEQYPCLTEAIDWCKKKGLDFDSINENIPNQIKLSGSSPKVMADIYIDDKALEFGNTKSKLNTIRQLKTFIK